MPIGKSAPVPVAPRCARGVLFPLSSLAAGSDSSGAPHGLPARVGGVDWSVRGGWEDDGAVIGGRGHELT